MSFSAEELESLRLRVKSHRGLASAIAKRAKVTPAMVWLFLAGKTKSARIQAITKKLLMEAEK